MITLHVPRGLVAIVDRALAREGLTVWEAALEVDRGDRWREVRIGAPVAGVPRLIAHDAPDMRGCGVG